MTTIKRYPNRKLYNTTAKQYITLEGIAELIRQGDEVQILDHATGEDLTALTLSQIVFEQEKKRGGFLPRSVLAGLVRAGGDTLASLRRTLAAPLDLLYHVDQEIERRLQELVDRGELEEAEGQRLRGKLIPKRRQAGLLPTEEDVERALDSRGVPTRAELQELNRQLEELAAKLEQLSAG